jgi:uncharacterized protein DUF6748/Kazal-type serine protease inhibitor-like protein
MFKHTRSWLTLAPGLWLLACSGVAADADAAGDGEGIDTVAQDLQLDGGQSYFSLRSDVRRCASPRCGGFFVQRVNLPVTRCADGRRRAECYVAELDLATLGLSDEQAAELRSDPARFLLRGEITPLAGDAPELGSLSVSEAWKGEGKSPARGAFVRAKNEGIVCITTPCLSFSGETLNLPLPAVRLAELDFSAVTDDPSAAFAQLNEPEGLLVNARPTIVSGPAGTAAGLGVRDYYLPFEPKAPAVACGSRGLGQCAEGEFCDFPVGADCGRSDAPGQCAVPPELCIEIFAPVCGCDGQTYPNSCFAQAAGVSVDFEGECAPEPRVCGTIAGLGCEAGEFCDFGVGQCRIADAAGECADVPEICPFIFNPVCGCDGQTYSNSCIAHSAGVSIDHTGSCP